MQNKDFEYFIQNMEGFYKTYGHAFIAIKNRRILGVYGTFNTALENTLKTEAIGTFLIQECFANREACIQHFQGNVIPVPA